MSTRITRVFQIGLPDGTERELEATIEKTVNNNYGADADGRRGEKRVTYEDVQISENEWIAFRTAVERSLENSDWED